MFENKGLHLLYKNLGETPHEAILRFKRDNPQYIDVSMTYAGRLDPMAEGLLLVLSGDKIKEKNKYLDLRKTYEVEILWGFETDTLDPLGLVVESCKVYKVESEEIEKELKKSIGKFDQKYPNYSSRTVLGKPLFQWAREERIGEIEIPHHEVEIFSSIFLSRRTLSKDKVLRDIKSKINSVSGDFRQKEIINCWNDMMSKYLFDRFNIDKIRLTASSGFYVRQFIQDLAKTFGTKALTFHIKRVSIGEYTIANILK